MQLAELKAHFKRHPERVPRIELPDGEAVPAHFHVTEVALVRKDFVDCGGTVRHTAACQLQVWLGSDKDHRLTAGKLAAILELAKELVPDDTLEVEVEYEDCAISQYTVAEIDVSEGELRLKLGNKHTDCLAKEACGIADSSCCADGCR